MPVNLDKAIKWKADIALSVDMYNKWFMEFAPLAFRTTRITATSDVEAALKATDGLQNIQTSLLKENPGILPTLRMSTCPPIAVDRLIGLSGANPTLVKNMELHKRLPPRMAQSLLTTELTKIVAIISKMADPDIFVWINRDTAASEIEFHRAATIVADRLCGAVANPIIRNAQEKRQLTAIKTWLEDRGYKDMTGHPHLTFNKMPPGSFSFRLNVPVKLEGGTSQVNIPIDAVVKPRSAALDELPIFFEAKSAGDFTNTNKRRKEEAFKMSQLRANYGPGVRFNLFLCGYFDAGYLGYEAAEGIDWAWEHRIDDMALFGL